MGKVTVQAPDSKQGPRSRLTVRGTTSSAIADDVRDQISKGDLVAGDALPPIRELAATIGVHRNTVAAAYRLLVAAGVAETRGRGGTVIRRLPTMAEEAVPSTGVLDLASGNPDPAFLPDIGAALSRLNYRPALYGSPAVDPRLAHWATTSMTDAVKREFAVSVTHGSVDAVERLLTSYLTRNDLVATEEPCFLASEGTVRVHGFRPAAVEIDNEGMRPESLATALKAGARAVIVTPRAHNPTGVSLSEERAASLRSVLSSFPHVLVIEDDHLSAVSSRPYFSITPAGARRWALVRSVAKFLGPDLRVALVASDLETERMLSTRLRPGASWVSHLLQGAVAELLHDPETAMLLQRAREAYASRATHLRKTLLDRGIISPFDTDGLNVWVPVGDEHSAHQVVHGLHEAGFAVRGGSPYWTDEQHGSNGIRITSSRLDATSTAAFAESLATVLATD